MDEFCLYPLDHFGIAVLDLDTAIAEYRRQFGIEVTLRETIKSQRVELAFLDLPNTKIELLAPTDPSSPLAKFLEKRGPGLHHVCYRVEDIKRELDHFEARGCKIIDRTPRSGAGNTLIAFIHPESMGGVLVELSQGL